MSRKKGSQREFMRLVVTAPIIARLVARAIIALPALFFFTGSLAQVVKSSPVHLPCDSRRCGLLTDGAYPNLVMGRVDHVGTTTDMTAVFQWAKAHGYWQSLPDLVQPYLHDVQLVTIGFPNAAKSEPVTLFMLQAEYHAAPLHEGDLVRYAPHDAAHDEAATGSPADLALFHRLTGCIATICQKGDTACFARYRQGAFTTAHGEEVSLNTGRLIPGGAHIDPASLLPVH